MMRVYSLTHIGKKRRPHGSLAIALEFGFILLMLTIILIVLFKYAENVSWEEAIWQVWQTTTTVGYGNRPAQTSAGRWLIMTISLFSISVLGVTIGSIFDYREEIKEMRRLGKMENPFKNGIVMFNFPGIPKFLDFERELRIHNPHTGICLVDEKLEELPQSIAIMPNIHFIRGAILDQETYKRARLRDNEVVIIFPENFTVPQSDGTTKIVVELVKNFVGEKTRIIYVLVDNRNSWMFNDLNQIATPVWDSLEILALVQECYDVYTAPVIQQLLLNTQGANPCTVPGEDFHGWKWGDFQIKSLQSAKKLGTRITAFALIKKGIPETCPFYDDIISKEDFISLIKYSDLKWDILKKTMLELHQREQQEKISPQQPAQEEQKHQDKTEE